MVFQETALVPDLAVWENIVLGWEQTTGPLLDKAGTLTALDELSREYGLPVPHRRRVGTLAMSVQQQVEILKVLYREARVVILDEPTGILTPQETRGLFLAIDKLKKAGKSVVFISHKLNEVLEIADTIHVMRAGELITTVAPGELAPRDLARLMLGSEPPSVERRVAHGEREAVFVATDLVVENPQSGATVGP
jgi:simple sugar transport system ATP-binding protein